MTQQLLFVVILLLAYSVGITILWYQIRHDPIRGKMAADIESLNLSNAELAIEKEHFKLQFEIQHKQVNVLLTDNQALSNLVNNQRKEHDEELSILLVSYEKEDEFVFNKKIEEISRRRSHSLGNNLEEAVKNSFVSYLDFKKKVSPIENVSPEQLLKKLLVSGEDKELTNSFTKDSDLQATDSYKLLLEIVDPERSHLFSESRMNFDLLRSYLIEIASLCPEKTRMLFSDLSIRSIQDLVTHKSYLEIFAALMENKKKQIEFFYIGKAINSDLVNQGDIVTQKLNLYEAEEFIFSNGYCLQVLKNPTIWNSDPERYFDVLLEIADAIFKEPFKNAVLLSLNSEDSKKGISSKDFDLSFQDPLTTLFLDVKPYQYGYYMLVS
jgi:hypothetical protein